MVLRLKLQGHQRAHPKQEKAKVPLAEMYKYSSTLRSISQGRAKFTRKFAEYQAVTPEIQSKLIKEHQEELQEA